jgi:hypothetical protein
MPNELVYGLTSSNNRYNDYYGVGDFIAGKVSSIAINGAVRFPGVGINQGQSVSRAGLYFFDGNIGGTGTIRLFIKGIKETNTADFTSDPMSRSTTTASVTRSNSGSATSWDIDVTTLFNEIVAQGGWSNGNALGFVLRDDSSDNDNFLADTGSLDILLSVRVTAPTLKPTPKTVSAPTFPSGLAYGMKISKPGIDVKTATETQLHYTSDKNYLRVLSEAQITTTAGVEYLIAHGLSYIPEAMAFVRADGKSFELPRLFAGVIDPITGGKQGFIAVDSTYVRITTTANATVYYYIFLDAQAS